MGWRRSLSAGEVEAERAEARADVVAASPSALSTRAARAAAARAR